MKKLNINKDDVSFTNKYKFNDLLNKIKSMGGKVIRSNKETLVVAAMIGCAVISSLNLYTLGSEDINSIKYQNIYSGMSQQMVLTQNNEDTKDYSSNHVFVKEFDSQDREYGYYIIDNNLYDINDNIVSLAGDDKPLYFNYTNVNEVFFENINLTESLTPKLSLTGSSVTENCIKYFPATLESLFMNDCHYIKNLNGLSQYCPNITTLSVDNTASLEDLNFIYELHNLEKLYIGNSAYITEDIFNYINSKGIKTNLTIQDVNNGKEIDRILNNIITPEMNEKDKIQAICLYMLENSEYDISQSIASNEEPLNKFLEDGKVVCATYAYVTNILLNKAGIESYEVINDNHAWNIINLDDKYYYTDTTNMDGSAIYNYLLKNLNISPNYMIDPSNTIASIMTKPESNKTIIPLSLIEDIQAGRSNKYIWEKYASNVSIPTILFSSILVGIGTAKGAGKINDNRKIKAQNRRYRREANNSKGKAK